MSAYPYTPSGTWGTTRGGGAQSLAADSPMPIAGAEAALQSGWKSVWWDNPLFWLVLFILVFMGYVFFSFGAGAKRVGSVSVKVGS